MKMVFGDFFFFKEVGSGKQRDLRCTYKMKEKGDEGAKPLED